MALNSPCFADDGEEKRYLFTAKGKDLAQLQEAKNCLDYQFCKKIDSSIQVPAGEEKEYRYQYRVSLSDEELDQLWANCAPAFAISNVSAQNETDDEPAIIPGMKEMRKVLDEGFFLKLAHLGEWESKKWNAFRDKLNPVYLHLPLYDRIESVQSHIRERMQNEAYGASIDEAIQEYEIPLHGYKIILAPEIKNDFLITHHGNKTITFPKRWLSGQNVCELINGIRHEAEHIAQIKHDAECTAEGETSVFSDHVERERAAYLNGILNFRRFCSDLSVVESKTQHALDHVFVDYFTHKNK